MRGDVVVRYDNRFVCLAANRPYSLEVSRKGVSLNGVRAEGPALDARVFHDRVICGRDCVHYDGGLSRLDAIGVFDCYVCVGEDGAHVLCEGISGEGVGGRCVRRRFYRRFVRAQRVGGEHPHGVLDEFADSARGQLAFVAADAVRSCFPGVARRVYRRALERMEGCDLAAVASVGALEGDIEFDEWEPRVSPVQWAALHAMRAAEVLGCEPARAGELIEDAFGVAKKYLFMPCAWWYDIRFAVPSKSLY